MSSFGKVIHISLFGESHGDYVGLVIENLPAGLELDTMAIAKALYQRKPKSELSTSRQENDNFQFLSGVFNGITTGAPLTILIPNNDKRSNDYNKDILRPSHSDFTAKIRYDGFNDYRGGGHFSGRLTAPFVVLGSICNQILNKKGIYVASHITSIKDIFEERFTNSDLNLNTFNTLINSDFPVLNNTIKNKYIELISSTKKENDSVGGVIETGVIGVPAGYGNPFFEKVQSVLSHLIFSIPSVKGLEFGAGFSITKLNGSQANDPFIMDNGLIKTSSNNSGGIQGGITNGMPIIFQTAIKPTSSIGKPQNSVDYKKREQITINIKGRHDPSIVHRVIHVINALTSYGILEIITRIEGEQWMN
jgi:chorismate synthase